jgi:hypothetical protein
LQQRVKLAAAIHGQHVVAAADRFTVDEDLGHRAATRHLLEPRPLGSISGDVDLLKNNAFLA